MTGSSGAPSSIPPSVRAPALATLTSRFLDPDERVRTAACGVVRDLPVAALVHVQPEVLQAVLGRCLDKKVGARCKKKRDQRKARSAKQR